ncbi:DNA polymerase III subunit delta [Frisingicoccus sp.]|uniref:DNA polymerase III subunit delta n=1 Tax=Frisingicoccus sp. TaxID=1918627 RepID=UPI002628D339|nr:DNA polymerase III subunit delta [Frisingicoccus sp.]MDD6233392.1 DNA polymerase III subunit delta [Frisingicoccus sp.]MDD6233395.1 DNA polymerase III subunit delta [Frisingicoccus sp.]MDY4921628.1 DNA polymerase III subunit delta [Frisingicoccus sp.]
MKILSQHMKSGQYKSVYLIYGEEDYLRKQYKDRMREALIGDDTMNYNYYEGKGISVKELIDVSETLPFFNERRLILVENSGFFSSSQEELAGYLKEKPETTCFLFVEKDVDKRNKLFKTVSSLGYAANMTAPDERTLIRWISGILKKEQRFMREDAMRHFLERIDTDMENIRRELDKLVVYTDGAQEITVGDIDEVCTVYTESQVFDMVRSVAEKQQSKALELYYDLIAQKEAPMRILYWITRQFNQLYQIKDLQSKGYPDHVIAERMGVRDFVVRKNKTLCQRFSLEELRKSIQICVEREEDVKTGRLNDRMAVELLIIQFSA